MTGTSADQANSPTQHAVAGSHLERGAELQHGSACADKLAAASETALDDRKELAAGLEDVGLLSVLHGLPALLPHQPLHCLPQLLLLSVHIHSATCINRLITSLLQS